MSQFTLDQLCGGMRKRIGNPDIREAPDRELSDFLQHAWEWVAAELDLSVTTDTTTLALTADVMELALPSDALILLFVEWNGVRLKGSSVFEWDRAGVDWRGSASVDVLREYAVQGRKLILYPPPSSTAVSTDSALTVRYYAQGATLATSSTAAPSLSEGDQMLVVERAAWQWNMLRSGEQPPLGQAALARANANQASLSQLLPQAKRRWQTQVIDAQPGISYRTRRMGAPR